MAVRVEVRAVRADAGRIWLDVLVIGTKNAWHQLSAVGIPTARLDVSVLDEILRSRQERDETPSEPEDTLPLF